MDGWTDVGDPFVEMSGPKTHKMEEDEEEEEEKEVEGMMHDEQKEEKEEGEQKNEDNQPGAEGGGEENKEGEGEEGAEVQEWVPCALTDAHWGEHNALLDAYCFWCESGPTKDQERHMHVVRMRELFRMVGIVPLRQLCGWIQTLYEEEFRPNFQTAAEQKRPWTLLSIRKHIRSHEALPADVERRLMKVQLKEMCNVMEDFEMCARHIVTGQKRINHDASGFYLKLVKQRDALMRSEEG